MNYKRIFSDGYSYFITMVTHNRNPLLIDNIEILRNTFAWSKKKYDYTIDAIVILPDYLHMIIMPKNSLEYPKIISHIKRGFLYGLDKSIKEEAKMTLSSSKYRRQHSSIWQDRYYEDTIRDEKDWLKRMKYIENNRIKQNLVKDTKN